MKRLLAAAILLVTCADTVAAQAVFVVRHAERADAGGAAEGMMAKDPELSEAGRARAQSLVATLRDAGISAIYVTEFKRTQQTAAPLATALGIPPTVVNANDTAGLIEKVKAATGNVLVVGHSNTVPEVIQKLGVVPAVTIGDADYDNLFVVVKGARPVMVRLNLR